MDNLREILSAHGFTCTDDRDLVEVWESRRSPRGEWIAVRFEDVFQKSVVQFEAHTVLQGVPIPTPGSEDDLKALMFEMGVG